MEHSAPVAAGALALLPLLFLLVMFAVGIVAFAFWIWMLIDCATKESSQGNEKLIWILVIVLTHFIGALIYFFVRRPARIREIGA